MIDNESSPITSVELT